MQKLPAIALLSACVALSIPSYAENSLKDRAQDFLSSRWNSSAKRKAISSELKKASRINARTLSGGITAINMTAGNHAGFVLYAGSSDDSPMVGYSISDTIDVASLPPAAAEFIARYKEAALGGKATRAIRPTGQDSPTYPIPTINPVEPFIRTKWGQGEPFNSKCPLYQGYRSVTGCDAVALGQVLHYYMADNFNDFTIEYADERSQEEVSVNFSKCKFDYANMLNVYAEGKYSQSQANAVAEMMYYTGAACMTKWSVDKSSGQWPVVALDKFFNINANYLYRDGLPTGYWMRKIQENLSAGKPILYTGTGVSNSTYSAHIFVLDGIDSENYVHVNWGWDGQADGYYDITFCHPEIFADNDDGYYQKQLMICDIEPRRNGEKYQEKYIATASTNLIAYNSNTAIEGAVRAVTTNSYDESKYGRRLILRKIGTPSQDYILGSAAIGACFPSWTDMRWNMRLDTTYDLEDGEYEMMVQTVDMDSDSEVTATQVPMRPYFTISAGSITGYGYKDYPEGKGCGNDETAYLSFNSFTPLTDVIAKAPFFAHVNTTSLLSSIGTSDISSADLCFTNIETGKKYNTQNSITLYNHNYSGLDYECVVEILPPLNTENNFTMPAGRYRIDVLASNSLNTDPRVIFPEPIYIEVAPAVDYPILQYDMTGTLMLSNWHYGQDYHKTWKDNIAVRINANYKGFAPSNNNYNPVNMMLFAKEANNPDAEEIMISSFAFDPTKYFSAYSTNLPGNLYPLEGEYIFYLRYLTPDGERDILPKSWDYIDKATGLPGTPTPHFINADRNAGLPMIEVYNLTQNGNKLTLDVKNIASGGFNGQIYLQIYDMKNGNINSVTSDKLTLASGESRQLIINAEMLTETEFDLYVRSIASASTRGATDDPTLATKPDGTIAHYQFTGGSDSGVENIASDTDKIKITSEAGKIIIRNAPAGSTTRVYTLEGTIVRETTQSEISGITPGLYIIQTLDTTVKLIHR